MRPSPRLALLTCAVALVSSAGVGLTASSAHATGAIFGNGVPGFVVSAANIPVPLTPVLQGTADFAGEPSIGINWNTGAGLFMAGTDTLKVTYDAATSHVTWSDASPFFGSSQNLDPILATDPTTGTTMAGGDTGACSAMFRSTDDGSNWLPTVPCTGTYDHPTVGWAPSALTPGGHVWYYCQQGPDEHNCTASSDGGLTWLPGTTTGLLTCIGLHGHIKGSADGYAYLPGKSCFDANSALVVGGEYTHDDGATWSEYTIPGATETAFDPAVAVSPSGTLYQAWEDGASSHPLIASSPDHGANWSAPIDLASSVSPPLVASTFPSLVAGDSGRLAYSFLGSSVGTGNPNTTGFHGVWYLYTSYSYDNGKTWTTVKDTPTPVQYGEVDSGGTTTSGQRNLLDFIDSAVTKDGRVVVAFADGCLADCEAAGTSGKPTAQADAEALSTHAWATVAYQNAGQGLLAANDVVLPPSAPALTTANGANGVSLTWTSPASDGGGPITSYHVYRSSGGGGATLLGSPTALAWLDTTAVRGTTYTYTVTAINSAGEGGPSNAATGVSYTVPGAPALTVTASGSNAALSWTVADNGGAPITGYQVLRGTSAGAETALATTTSGSYTDSGLTVGQTYFYKVVAANAAGTGTPSPEVSFSNATAPGVPSLTATAQTNQIALTWTAPSDGGAAISGYVVRRGTASGAETTYTTLGAVTSYADTAVTPGVAYYYQVQAVNTVGTGAASPERTATPYTTAAAPTLSATPGKTQVTLSWTVPNSGGTSITGYQIYRSTTSGKEVLVQTISTGTTYIDSVPGGVTYYYRVAAVTAAGTGTLSREVAVSPRR